MSGKRLYREYDENRTLVKLECCKCGEIKTINNFNKNKSLKDGYQCICKLCMKEYKKQYKIENKEKISEYQRQYHERYKEENKEKIRENSYKYRKNNKEKISEIHKKYYQENKEKLAEYRYQYYQENKEKLNERHRQYDKNKAQIEILKIYENVTKQLYPHNGIQYGIIYGVYCKVSNRWYIGQSINSFSQRYHNNFFNCKNSELSKDSNKGQLLQDDIEKYGQENFEIFEVIDVAFSEKELDEKEVYYIDLYKAYDEGYNSNRGNIFKHEKSKRKDVI